MSSASSCSLEDSQLIQPAIFYPSPITRIRLYIYVNSPYWLRNTAFGLSQLVLLPFTQGLSFALGLYLGRTLLMRPLMAKLRLRQ